MKEEASKQENMSSKRRGKQTKRERTTDLEGEEARDELQNSTPARSLLCVKQAERSDAKARSGEDGNADLREV